MLGKSENNIICLLFFASIMVFANIGGVSCSLPIGAYALLKFYFKPKPSLFSKHIKWLSYLFLVGVISSIFSSVSFQFRNAYFLAQFLYWLLLARAIGALYPVIDKKQMSWTIVLGCSILGACNLLLGLGTQNSVAFILVVLGPLGMYGLNNRRWQLFYGILLWGLMLFNESRSGLAILTVELLFIMCLHVSKTRVKQIVIVLSVLIGVFVMSPQLRKIAGNIIEPYNEEMAMLLTNPEQVQAYDKSWIQRQVQVQKGIQIFEEYPVIGIGANNFTPMDIRINENAISDKIDANVLQAVMKRSDNRSTHNTYITLLSEFGVIGTTLWILFIFPFLWLMYKRLKTINDFEYMIFVTTIGMSVYFYTIAALYGTAAWLFYGLIYGCYKENSNKVL